MPTWFTGLLVSYRGNKNSFYPKSTFWSSQIHFSLHFSQFKQNDFDLFCFSVIVDVSTLEAQMRDICWLFCTILKTFKRSYVRGKSTNNLESPIKMKLIHWFFQRNIIYKLHVNLGVFYFSINLKSYHKWHYLHTGCSRLSRPVIHKWVTVKSPHPVLR